MKGKTLGHYRMSDEDFEFIVTKPLFALGVLGFWILKVSIDAKGELHVFLGVRRGVVNGVMPCGSGFWEEVDRLLD